MGVRDAIILGKRSVRHICTRPTTTFKKFCPAVQQSKSDHSTQLGQYTIIVLLQVPLRHDTAFGLLQIVIWMSC